MGKKSSVSHFMPVFQGPVKHKHPAGCVAHLQNQHTCPKAYLQYSIPAAQHTCNTAHPQHSTPAEPAHLQHSTPAAPAHGK